MRTTKEIREEAIAKFGNMALGVNSLCCNGDYCGVKCADEQANMVANHFISIIEAERRGVDEPRHEMMYERVAPMVEEMRAKYPIDLSGLEPALTQDIAAICLRVIDDYKQGRFVLIEGNDVNK